MEGGLFSYGNGYASTTCHPNKYQSNGHSECQMKHAYPGSYNSVSNSIGSTELIPSQKEQIKSWFTRNVGSITSRKTTLDPALVSAESSQKIVTVRTDGNGMFKTIMEAINSIPKKNANRVIVSIGLGTYQEKLLINKNKPFVTFFGDPKNNPTIFFDGTKTKFNGTRASATLSVEADYFMCVNLIIKNTAPKPKVKDGDQAVALNVKGNRAAFYNCKFSGFQDTLCDDDGKHFYKDCYIEGAVDFIFYLNTEVHVLTNQSGAFITEQESTSPDKGYSFVHCAVTGLGQNAYLGRAMHPYSTVVFSYSELGDIVKPEGWFAERNFDDKNTFYGEYQNSGDGSRLEMRRHVKKRSNLSGLEVAKFLNLDFIDGSQWLLPPPAHI